MAVIGSSKLLGGGRGGCVGGFAGVVSDDLLLRVPLSAVSVCFSAADSEVGALALVGLPAARSAAPMAQFFGLSTDDGRPSPELLAYLDELFQLAIPFVFHDLKAALLRFWSWGFRPHFAQVYDTKVAASCVFLGHRAQDPGTFDPETELAEQSRGAELAAKEYAQMLSIPGLTTHYHLAPQQLKTGVPVEVCALSGANPSGGLLEEAWTVLQIYQAQLPDLLRRGLLHHLYTLEFPFIEANAYLQHCGVRLSQSRLARLRRAAAQALAVYGPKLRALGMGDPNSRPDFLLLLSRLQLLDHFTVTTPKTTEPSLTDEVLLSLEHLHPAVRWYRLHRMARRLDRAWAKAFKLGPGGRIHPEHVQNGAVTGRSTCRDPPLANLDYWLKPLIVASEGCGLGELDIGQLEPAVAGFEFNDAKLQSCYRDGDVYAPVAAQFSGRPVASDSPEREEAKPFFLSCWNGKMASTLAREQGISEADAAAKIEQILNLFPGVKAGLARAQTHGGSRGYALMRSGLRRQLPTKVKNPGWAQRVLRNTPVQGSAALVFKLGLTALYREFGWTAVKVVMVTPDSYMIEAPLDTLPEALSRAHEILQDCARPLYPGLSLKLRVNAAEPSCWNKAGDVGAFERVLCEFNHEPPGATHCAQARSYLDVDEIFVPDTACEDDGFIEWRPRRKALTWDNLNAFDRWRIFARWELDDDLRFETEE